MIEKLELEQNPLSETVEKIREICPAAVTRDGKIDFEELKTSLATDVAEDTIEKYEFTWVGKNAAKAEANRPIRKTLRPVVADSKDWDNTKNLYIEGDNLDALKLLQESYLGKVKMIYIDPPYNTGNDFVYCDNFKMGCAEFIEKSGQCDADGNRLFANTKTNGRFHSDWCSMMYPRLKIARNLLTDDGVIFISIDDHEQANLKKICDEVFGEDNFITTFIWEKTQHFGRQKLNNYSNADYVMCYAKSLYDNKLKELLVEKINGDMLDAPLYNASNNVKRILFPAKTVKFNITDGDYIETTSEEYVLENPVNVKNGVNQNDFYLSFKSRWAQNTVNEEIAKGTTFWVKTTSFAIRAIYNSEKTTNVAPKQIIFTNAKNPFCAYNRFDFKVTTSEVASNEVNELLKAEVFSYPKPVGLLSYFGSLLYDERL